MKPSRTLLWLAGACLGVALTALWWPGVVPFISPLCIAMLVLAGGDALMSIGLKPPIASRELPGIVNRDQVFTVKLNLRQLPDSRRILVYDGIPEYFSSNQLPLFLGRPEAAIRRSGLGLGYQLHGSRRGEYAFQKAWCHYLSRLGLWWRMVRIAEAQSIKVFPPFWKDETSRLALMAGSMQAGAFHSVRRRGLGTEFHQLRDYRQGDSLRLMDWKATGRFHRPVVRDYQEEQNQEIYFVLDAGYRMNAAEGGVSHFDRALESLLLLARIALRQGDSVGVLVFGPQERWIAPVKGVSGMNLLLSRLYDLESHPLASSPSAALEKLQTRLRRRSLVVLMSNLREEDGEGIGPHLPRLLSNHLLLTLWLREKVVDEILVPPFRTLDSALSAAAARLYLEDRSAIQKRWQAQGVMMIDTTPDQLSAQLVNKYWEIKKSGRL